MSRSIAKLVRGMSVSDGAGVRLKRTIGASVDYVDPFLMLDEFKSDSRDDYIAGFPSHPHRGFETVTYMLAGSMEHKDHKGNRGNLVAGSIQWMTAGRGIIHSEMPKQDDGLMWGFQLWINLPAKSKMCEPRYQDIPPEDVPLVKKTDGIEIKVLAGEVDGIKGPVNGVETNPTYLDIRLPPNTKFSQPIPEGHNGFVYVFEGNGSFGPDSKPTDITIGNMGTLGSGDHLEARSGGSACRFLLVAAKPLNEPMARHGPFVMNTRDQLMQAFADYHAGKF